MNCFGITITITITFTITLTTGVGSEHFRGSFDYPFDLLTC